MAALLRHKRNRCIPPVAVYTGMAPNCFVYAANRVARTSGVKEGMPLAEAKARFAASKTAPAQQEEKRRDDGKSRGIRPYRLRPASPMAAMGGTGDQEQATRNKEITPDTLGGPSGHNEEASGARFQGSGETGGTGNSVCPLPSRDRGGTVQPTSVNILPKGTACRAPTTEKSSASRGSTDQRFNESTAHGPRPTVHEFNDTLQIYPRDPEAEKLAQQELLELALTISPRAEDTAPGLIILDMAGLPDPHASASDFSLGVEKLGLETHVAVSQNRFVALCAARTQPGLTHVFPGEEAGFLQALPLDVLPLDPKEEETLERWGIRKVGELARLPENSLVARFGERGGQLVKLARGQGESVLCPYEPPPALEEKIDFDWQVAELESLSFLLSDLLNRLCWKLEGHRLAAEEIRLSLKLADGSWFERAVSLSSPLTDPRVLLALLRLDLAAHPPGEAIEGAKVSAQPTPRRMVQFCLFEPPLPSPEKLAVTLARLSNLVGPGRVGAPVAVDTHRPGAFAITDFAPVNGKGKRQGTRDKKVETSNHAGPLAQSKVRTGTPAGPSAQSEVGTGNPAGPLPSRDRKGAVQLVDADIPQEGTACRAPTGIQESSATLPRSNGSSVRQFNRSPAHGSRLTAHVSTVHGQSRQSSAFRCFRPSPEAEVFLRGSQPVYVTAAEIQGRVHARAGPWRICGEWWTENGWDYEEWDVEVDGRLYRICCERSTQNWYVTGMYD